MKITIIRHAEPDYENNTLTEKGFKEAEILGKYLKDEKLDYIYVSPFQRADYTAKAILKYNKNKEYKTLDFIHEFRPFMWDKTPTFLNSDERVYHHDKWTEVPEFNYEELKNSYKWVKDEFNALIKEHGYEKQGAYYKVIKPNHDNLVFVCHFGLESFLLSELLNIPVNALLNHTCASPSAITTVYTEEREKGKAIFRLNVYGSLEHLILAKEPVSFMARFDEVYGDGNDNIT